MQMWSLWVLLCFVAAAMVIGMWYMRRTGSRREQAIIAARRSDTLEGLMACFPSELQPVARALYTCLQDYTFSKRFPFRKSDLLAKTINIEGDDLDEALTKVAEQFGCRKPTKEDDAKFRGRKTFEDYVEFVNHLRTT